MAGITEERRLEFRRVGLGLRAPRPAVLIGSQSDWVHCLALVQALTETWGGSTFAVVPTDGKTISPLFWSLLKLHDPDWFMVLGDTVAVSEELEQTLKQRHSVAAPWGDHIWSLGPGDVSYPFTGVYDALPDSESFPTVTDVKVKANPLTQLTIYASTGWLSEPARTKLSERGVEFDEQVLDLSGSTGGLYEVGQDIWGLRSPRTGRHYPFSLSSEHLGLYVPLPSAIDRHPLAVVCGRTIDDFAYFWNLRALRALPLLSNVYWLPRFEESDVKQDEEYGALWPWLAAGIEAGLRQVWGEGRRLLVTSLSLEHEALTSVGRALYRALLVHGDQWSEERLPSEVVSPREFDQLLPYIAEFWEKENTPALNTSVVQFVGGEGMAVLDTPTPSSVAFKYESEMRWIVEVLVESLRVPTRPSMTDLLIRRELLADCRASKNGVAFTAVSHLKLAGEPPRSLLVRPVLRLPADWEVFDTLCEAEGLVVSLSDKGQYEREALRFFGGLEALAADVRDARVATTLLKFVDDSPNRKGVVDEGVKIGGRDGRILDFVAVTKLWDGDESAAQLFLDRNLQRRVIHRGLFVGKCPYCRRADWYRLAELSDSVTCHRCSREFVYPAESGVHFKLDELVAQAVRHGSHIPWLVLDFLRRRSTVSFLFTTACDIFKRGKEQERPWLEIDLLAVADGSLMVGECKRGGALSPAEKAQLRKYVELCRVLRPDGLVVATDAAEWNEDAAEFLAALRGDLSAVEVRMERITGTDIRWPLTPAPSAPDL